jgi:hypothetical protein
MKEIITIDFGDPGVTVGACFAARDGNEMAKRYLVREVADNPKAAKIVVDFIAGKFKRKPGRPPSAEPTPAFVHNLCQHEVLEQFIEEARRQQVRKPVYEGACRTVEYLRAQGSNRTVMQLLDARRRGKRRKPVLTAYTQC